MNTPKPTSRRIGDDRLLGIEDVCNVTGFCPQVASRLIKDSGRGIFLHRRLFILESSLLAYLREQEAQAC